MKLIVLGLDALSVLKMCLLELQNAVWKASTPFIQSTVNSNYLLQRYLMNQ